MCPCCLHQVLCASVACTRFYVPLFPAPGFRCLCCLHQVLGASVACSSSVHVFSLHLNPLVQSADLAVSWLYLQCASLPLCLPCLEVRSVRSDMPIIIIITITIIIFGYAL